MKSVGGDSPAFEFAELSPRLCADIPGRHYRSIDQRSLDTLAMLPPVLKLRPVLELMSVLDRQGVLDAICGLELMLDARLDRGRADAPEIPQVLQYWSSPAHDEVLARRLVFQLPFRRELPTALFGLVR